MEKRTKRDEQLEQAVGTFFKSIWKGILKLKNLSFLLIFVIVVFATIIMMMQREMIMEKMDLDEAITIQSLVLRLVWLLPFVCLCIFGAIDSEKKDDYAEKFASIKFCSKSGQYPILIKQREEGKTTYLSFKSQGITMSEWRSRKEDLEAVLDCNILRISTDSDTKTIINLDTVSSDISIPEKIRWNDELIIPNEKDSGFSLVAGQEQLDQVILDLNKYPHALIAGTTGSGKSVVLRVLLWECIKKGATPYFIDFKGGIELTAFEQFGEVVYERDQALDLLKELTAELKLRLALFRNEGVKNLIEYNNKFPDKKLTRVVIGCDEVAEMLDKTGLSAADAAIYKEIEKEMSTIARLGRAPGINMLLGTQRPDAKVIVGQIKNNLPIRICGRMTDVHASEMVLGNTLATTLNSEIRGRFLYNVGADTFEFQGYLFEDSDIIYGNYREGVMLVDGINSNDAAQIFSKIKDSGEMVEDDEPEPAKIDGTRKRRGLNF